MVAVASFLPGRAKDLSAPPPSSYAFNPHIHLGTIFSNILVLT